MKLKYENGELSIQWEYTITRHTHVTSLSNGKKVVQHIINLNNHFLKLSRIRQVLFIYENEGTLYMTPREPIDLDEYETVLTRTNGKQTTIQLPKELGLKDKEPQKAILNYYPNRKDPQSQVEPQIVLDIIKAPVSDESKAKITQENGEIYLVWENDGEEITPDLAQFLNDSQKDEINASANPLSIKVNAKTLDVEIDIIPETAG